MSGTSSQRPDDRRPDHPDTATRGDAVGGDVGGDLEDDGGPVDDADPTLVWALPPERRWALWGLIAVLVVILGVVVWRFAVHGIENYGIDDYGIDDYGLLYPAAVVVFAGVVLLRGVVAIVIDPREGTVLLFRAGGGAVRTRPERIQRIDRGQLTAISELSRGERKPPRIVTLDGTARLSWLFPDPEEVGFALADLAPHAQIDL